VQNPGQIHAIANRRVSQIDTVQGIETGFREMAVRIETGDQGAAPKVDPPGIANRRCALPGRENPALIGQHPVGPSTGSGQGPDNPVLV
jgi:hypothetical protein